MNAWSPLSGVERVDPPALASDAHRIPGLPSHNPTVSNTTHLVRAPSRVVLAMPV